MRAIWYRFVGWAGTNRVTRVLHPILYRWTGGAGILGRSLGHLTILLTTTGRRSGRARTTALWTFPHGPSLVVVGTNGGSRRTPAWVLNLRARPAATITIGTELRPVHAREAAGVEYERLWAQVVAAYPGYEAYRGRAGRAIPLVVLEAD